MTREDRLCAEMEPLVAITRRRMLPTLPPGVEEADLLQVGRVGLLLAVRLWDPRRGTKLTSYAVTMIRAAMLEELRQQDWVKRAGRRREREEGAVLPALVSLDEPALGDEEPVRVADQVPGPDDTEREALARVAAAELREELALLPRAERRVMRLRVEGLTQAEAARRLGVSESRAFQLVRQARSRLDREGDGWRNG